MIKSLLTEAWKRQIKREGTVIYFYLCFFSSKQNNMIGKKLPFTKEQIEQIIKNISNPIFIFMMKKG